MSHAPKTAALMAYESGALSQDGRARMERHLGGCPVCQRELATIQAYEATVDAIRDDRGPELDWSKMELALEREAQAQAKKHRRGWILPAAGVVLAAAAALLLAMPTGTTGPTVVAEASRPYVIDRAPTHETSPGPSVEHAPAMYASAIVTLVAGASEIRSEGSVASASAGARLGERDVIATSESGSLHARLGGGLGVAVEPGTELRLASLDGDVGVPELALDHGRVAARVHGTRTVFLAGEFRIEADVASFVIDFDAERDALTVDVREGVVHVTGPNVDERLTGPARFPTDASALEAAQPVGSSEDYDAQPSLHVTHADIVRWEIGDAAVRGSDQIAMRVGAGPTTISGWDARGRLFRATVNVGADGLDLSPDELRPEAPRVHAGTLEMDEWVPVVRQHQRDLQRCYEHELRATPTLSVHVRARVVVEMTGSVADDGITYSGDEMPPAMARCVTNQIQTWIFPAPHGGPVTLPIPFGFDPQ